MNLVIVLVLILVLLGVAGRGFWGFPIAGQPYAGGFPNDPVSIVCFILVVFLLLYLLRGISL